MKILHVVSNVPGYPGSGGAEKFCFDLAAHQKEKGIEAEVAAPFNTKEYQGVKIHHLHKVSNKWLRKLFFDYWNPQNVLRLRKILKEVKPDAVHFHNFYGIGSQLASYASRNVPTIITAHDYWPFCYWASMIYHDAPCDYCLSERRAFKLRNLFHGLHTLINKRFFSKCKFVSPSEFLANKLRTNGKFSNTEVVYNAIEKNSFPTQYEKIILWVGRLTKVKGLATIAPLLDEFIIKNPEWSVIILGDGPEKKILQEKYKRLKFIGYAQSDDYYKRASIYIMSSTWQENMPLTILEAMQAGICILTTTVGGIPEMVFEGRNGFFYCEAKDFSEKLYRLITNPELIHQMGEEGKKIFETQFSFNKCVSRYNEIYASGMSI
jgi:glycosyltransferase involved in cell wall biosynthesis